MPTTLRHGALTARIDEGELVGFSADGHEFIHQKGSPGWRNADTEMFPVIGPTAEAGYRITTPRGPAVQDQHGLLRELAYRQLDADATGATYEKVYSANTPVANSKFPARSTAKELGWPYSFRFRKTFQLGADSLQISFAVSADAGMPFMLGYHPAFRLTTATPAVETADGRRVSLDDILAVGSRALHLPDAETLTLHDARQLRIIAEGFGAFMCWTEVRNMVCLEPITFYPYAVAQADLAQGFRTLAPDTTWRASVRLEPLDA